MPLERVGFRRLYDSIGCSLADQEELRLTYSVGSIQVEIYMGAKPKLGIYIEKFHEKYLVPGASPLLGELSYHSDATQSGYPRSFFTEIFCSREVEVSAELSSAFYRNEQQANQQLLDLAARDEREYREVTDYISGIIGLRFHPQFVRELLNENFVALRKTDHVITHYGSTIEQLEGVQLNKTGIAQMQQRFPTKNTATQDEIRSRGIILFWLLRAWNELDSIARLVALFIPLEMILGNVRVPLPEERHMHVKEIRELIASHGGEKQNKLINFFDFLVGLQNPSIKHRFALFAERANLPGWRSDIKVFENFCDIRNDLLHRGKSVGIAQIQILEELVERYVNYHLFQDTAVYQSRWKARPNRQTKATDN